MAQPPVLPSAPGLAVDVDEALMMSIATGTTALSELVDPLEGLGFVEVYEDATGESPDVGEDGIVRSARLLCDEELDSVLRMLREDLQRRVEQVDEAAQVFTCSGLTCSHPAEMEYDLSAIWTFRRSRSGRVVLESVVRVEGGPMSVEFEVESRSWARDQLELLLAEEC